MLNDLPSVSPCGKFTGETEAVGHTNLLTDDPPYSLEDKHQQTSPFRGQVSDHPSDRLETAAVINAVLKMIRQNLNNDLD